MVTQIVINRKRGKVVRLMVEIDASQARAFNNLVERLGISKADGIAAALNVWFNAVEPPQEKQTDGLD